MSLNGALEHPDITISAVDITTQFILTVRLVYCHIPLRLHCLFLTSSNFLVLFFSKDGRIN
jgi:hypothetical protein